MTDITVIIPCYNQPEKLANCLESIDCQTFRNFEIVILDDASSVDYSTVIKRFEHLQIKYIRNPKNLGAMKNMIKAIHHECTSDYVIVFHEDDIMHPRLLEYELLAMELAPNMVFVGTGMVGFDKHNSLPQLPHTFIPSTEIYSDEIQLCRAFLRGVSFNFGSVLYSRKAVVDIYPDYDRYNTLCDRPFLCEIARKGNCGFIQNPLVYYRSHPYKEDQRGIGLSENNLINFYTYYRSLLPSNWQLQDKKLFYGNAMNNLFDSYLRLQKQKRSGLLNYYNKCVEAEIFNLKYLNQKGIRNFINQLMDAY